MSSSYSTLKDIHGCPLLITSKGLDTNPAQSNKHHIEHRHSLALEIYQDLIHIRDHTLYESYTKEVPKLLRIPVMSFIAAISKNHDPEHPVRAVRNSLIDIGIEDVTLTLIGLSIGETPAAIALMASHWVESGLEHFPSWEQIDRMPRSTQQERLAWARMIEVLATAKLLAWPSKATQILSRSIKSWMDDAFSKKHSEKDVTSSSLKFIPSSQLSKFPTDRNLFLGHEKPFPSDQLISPLTYPKRKGLSEIASPKTAWDVIPKQMSKKLSSLKNNKPQLSPVFYPPKFNGLSENNKPQTAWDNIRLRIDDAKLSNPTFKGLALGHEPRTAWDIIRLKPHPFSPTSNLPEPSVLPISFRLEKPSHFPKSQSNSAFGKGSSSLFSESRPLSQGLAYQPFSNGRNKLNRKGAF